MIFVVVPKDAYPKYFDMGWSEMVAAAREGCDGLAVVEQEAKPNAPASVRKLDCAVFRDGAGAGVRTPNTAVLHAQGW